MNCDTNNYNRINNCFVDSYPILATFDDIVQNGKEILVYQIINNRCYSSCYNGLKDKFCKHSIAVGLVNNWIASPVNINIYELKNKRKPGRTHKAKRILTREVVKTFL